MWLKYIFAPPPKKNVHINAGLKFKKCGPKINGHIVMALSKRSETKMSRFFDIVSKTYVHRSSLNGNVPKKMSQYIFPIGDPIRTETETHTET